LEGTLGNSPLFMEETTQPSAGMYDFLGWFEANKKRIAIGAVIALFAALVLGFLVWRSGQKKIEAELALSAVPVAFTPNEPAKAGTGDALMRVATDYDGTPAASKALVRAGTAYFAEGDFAKAQAAFERFLKEYPEAQWVPQAVFGIAATLEAQNKTTEAIAKYNEFVKFSSDPAIDQARLNLARLYEQTKQPALALELLKKMTEGVQPGGFSPTISEAQERIREIYANNPSLVPSNPVTSPNMLSPVTLPATNAVTVPSATSAAPKVILNQGPTTPAK
jgi:tetratricopeptide (TPR) repeat protein